MELKTETQVFKESDKVFFNTHNCFTKKAWNECSEGLENEVVLLRSFVNSTMAKAAAKGGSGSSLNEIRGYERWVEQDDCLVCHSQKNA